MPAVLERLARRHVYAITSFIFGLDNDSPGVAERTLARDARLASGAARLWADHAVPGDSSL